MLPALSVTTNIWIMTSQTLQTLLEIKPEIKNDKSEEMVETTVLTAVRREAGTACTGSGRVGSGRVGAEISLVGQLTDWLTVSDRLTQHLD